MENIFDNRYGVKVRNIDSAVLLEHNRGIRPYLSYTKATVPNSLLLDFLKKNGLRIKGASTRDLIGLSFNYGTNSFDHELKKLQNKLQDASTIKEEEFYQQLIENATKNKDKYEKISKAQIRKDFYENGVEIDYGDEKIRYLPLYRSSGRAKLGSCTFINENLYDIAIDYLRMGMELPDEDLDITGIQAYSSLAASSIKDKITILPEEILCLKDVDSIFRTKVISVETDKDKHCITREIDDYPLKNTLFDGQGLIDDSIFPDWANGYVLLRNHFTKLAAFHCDIQKFMKDYFGNDYETATVKDYWGRDVKVSAIKLITTDNAFKFIKMGMDFDTWASKVEETNDNQWGIVKSVYESKLGDVQRMSYQMVNALDLLSIDSVIKTSKEYIRQLKSDDKVFIDYLKKNVNYANDYEVLIALYEHNPMISRSSYFRERRKEIIKNYLLDFKNGRVIQNSDNLVIAGNPYAMLLHSVGEDPLQDPTFKVEDKAIQVWTERFDDGKYLASFRSPFNSQNNLCRLHNVYHSLFDEYFYPGKLTVFVNMIGTDFQARNNGSDQDSDTIYVTDQEDIVRWAEHCLEEFPTIENNIPKETNSYRNTMEDFALVDTKIAAANTAIGEASNLAQLCLTYGYNFNDRKFKDYACILAVLAQVAIDNAKRCFDVDLNNEIRRIKKDLQVAENGLPLFWFYIKRKGKFAKQNNQRTIMKNFNPSLVCPMNYLCELKFPRYRSSLETIPITDFLIREEYTMSRKLPRKIEKFVEKYSIEYKDMKVDGSFDKDLMDMEFEELINDIHKIYINKDYKFLMSYLLKRAFKDSRNSSLSSSLTHKHRPILLKVLYTLNPTIFISCFKGMDEMKALPENR